MRTLLGLTYSRSLRIWFCNVCCHWQHNKPTYKHECPRQKEVTTDAVRDHLRAAS